ncbi:MAG TPA: hypothetical protein VF520_11865, partial [Thermoleophilaceae bacterium]
MATLVLTVPAAQRGLVAVKAWLRRAVSVTMGDVEVGTSEEEHDQIRRSVTVTVLKARSDA